MSNTWFLQDLLGSIAERLRRSVEESPLPAADGVDAPLRLTVSIGYAVPHAGEGLADIIARADSALYAAKRSGRNRVCAAPEPGEFAAPAAPAA